MPSLDSALVHADRLGYPVAVKASAGAGGRVIGPELAADLVKAFLGAHYLGNDKGGERFARRVGKIKAMEDGIILDA